MTGSSLSNSQKPIKYGTGNGAGIELVPQPSDDPEDPLVSFLLSFLLSSFVRHLHGTHAQLRIGLAGESI